MLTPTQRWELRIPHSLLSVVLMDSLRRIDKTYNEGALEEFFASADCEEMLYLLDIYFSSVEGDDGSKGTTEAVPVRRHTDSPS